MPSGVYKLTFELSGFKPFERDNIAVVLGQTISFDAQLEVGGLTETHHGHRRLAARRRLDDEDRHQPEGRRADRGAELHRRVGRAVGSAGRAHAGLRRRRQPQEPAVGLRDLRHPEPGARRLRRHRPHRGRRRHRVLRGLLRQRGGLDQRARRRRRDELRRRRHRDHHQERRQRRSRACTTSATSRAASSARTPSRATWPRRGYPARTTPTAFRSAPTRTCCSGRATSIWAARSCATRPGSTAPTTTSRSTSWCRASPNSCYRPRHLRQLHRQGHLEARAEQHRHRLLPAGPQAEAAARPLVAAARPNRCGPRTASRGCTRASGSACSPTARSSTSTSATSRSTGRWWSRSTRRPTPPKLFRATTAVAGAGWNAFTTYRKKPQVKAQLTYYLPEKAGSHDFKFGFESILDSYRYGHNGTSGRSATLPLRRHDLRARSHPLRRYRRGVRLCQRLDGRRRTPTRTTPSTLQDRWAPNNKLTFTAGRPLRLPAGRLRGRDAQAGDSRTCLPDGTRIFPVSTNVTGRRRPVQHQLRAAARRDLGPQGHRRSRAEGVLRPLLQQPGRRLLGDQSGRPVDCGVQLPRSEPQRALRRAVGARHAAPAPAAPTARRSIPTSRRPYTDEISGSLEFQLPG